MLSDIFNNTAVVRDCFGQALLWPDSSKGIEAQVSQWFTATGTEARSYQRRVSIGKAPYFLGHNIFWCWTSPSGAQRAERQFSWVSSSATSCSWAVYRCRDEAQLLFCHSLLPGRARRSSSGEHPPYWFQVIFRSCWLLLLLSISNNLCEKVRLQYR